MTTKYFGLLYTEIHDIPNIFGKFDKEMSVLHALQISTCYATPYRFYE